MVQELMTYNLILIFNQIIHRSIFFFNLCIKFSAIL